MVERATHEFEKPHDELAQVNEFVGNADLTIRTFVRERPVVAIACALVVGAVVGKILSRL